MKYLIGIIGLGLVLAGAGEWQQTDWKSVGIVSDYNCDSCTDAYSYKGWRFTQTAQLGIYHPVVSIPQTGSGYCDHQCLTASDDSFGETDYYDAIGDMRAYRRGNDIVAIWSYRHASGGPILSDGYYYRCIVKDGKIYKEGKIHEIPEPDWLDSNHPEECAKTSKIPSFSLSKDLGIVAVSPVKTFRYTGQTEDHLSSTLILKITRNGLIEGVCTIKGKTSPPGQPCWMSSRTPYHGVLTGKPNPAATGVMESTYAWCDDPKIKGMNVPESSFSMWHEKGRGLILSIGETPYQIVYPTPPVNPFPTTSGTSQSEVPTFPSGTWQTTFGTMVLQVKNGSVSGNYTHDKGRITGSMNGRRLLCQWSEFPTYRPAHDAGDCYFDFSADGKRFSGKWRYGHGTGRWDGDWSGYKIDEQRSIR